MIGVQVRRELCGPVVARAACGLAWKTALGDLDQAAFPLLGALDPYGDAVSIAGRFRRCCGNWNGCPSGQGGVSADEVRALGGRVLQKVHHYLVFVGD